MIKALTTIEGVAEDIDPDFDLMGFARPHVEKLIKDQYSIRALKARFKRNAGKWFTLAERLPSRLATILDRLGGNKFSIGLDVKGLETLERTVHHSSRQLSYSVLVAAMIMASSILVLAAKDEKTSLLGILGFVGFLVSFLFAFLILLENVLAKVRRKKK
jgi:ubiquinone biosynthesis protein